VIYIPLDKPNGRRLGRIMPIDVFISHSQQDKVAAEAACSALEAAGIRCWIAPRDVPPGAQWPAAIIDAIDHCRAMVLIFSSGANQSRQVYREVQRAFDKEVPVVPFRIENVTLEHSLAYYVETVHWLDAVTPPLENHLKQLAVSIAALLNKGPLPENFAVPNRMDGGADRPAQLTVQPKSGSRPFPKWILIAAGFVAAIVATAGLMSALQRPPASSAGQPTLPAAAVGTTTQPATPAAPAAPPSNSPVSACSIPICGDWYGVGNTVAAPFGGAPYCRYSASLQNPTLEANVDNYGRVTKAFLSLTIVESTVGSCALFPLGTRSHSYSGGGTTSGTKIQLELNPAPENQPQASANFSGEVVNGRLLGTLTVHRTDIGGNLAWTVRSLVN
jgi:TIR domain